MNKQEMLIEYIVQDIIAYLVEDTNINVKKAMHEFYISKTHEKLLDVETGLYLESAPYVYDIFKAERKEGHLTQLEY